MQALTKREDQVAEEISRGSSEKMIADKLCISEHTVHSHKKNLRKKMAADSDKDVVRIYVLSNLEKFLVVFFLSLQFFMIYSEARVERVFPSVRKVESRSVRARKGKKDLYEC